MPDQDEATATNQTRPINLLLVDDRPVNLTALRAILERPDYNLLTATSGADALKIVLEKEIAVVLLDVMMPVMDGFEVARYLKQAHRTRDIPILFLTAIATDVQQIYRAYDVGAVDYLVKPLDPEVVRRKVAVFVELVRQRAQLREQADTLREADRREYELKLAELRFAGDRRYRKLVEGIDHAIGWTMDDTLRLTFASRRATDILGYSAEQLAEPGWFIEHVYPEDRDAVLATFRRALDEGIELVADHRLLSGDGRAVWFHTGVSGERDGRELHGISVDISDLKRAQVEAEHATRVREELLAIVAHDLRNPLASIRTGAELLDVVSHRAHEPNVTKTARTIVHSADRMEHLIDDLLDFALMQADRLTIEPRTVKAAGLVCDSVDAFRSLANERGLKLEGDAREGIAIRCDRDRVLQILENLIGNALKFTPKGGTVSVRVDQSDEEAVFAVSDTGPGIPPDELDRIWDRYWQPERSRKGRGVGLGLSIAKGLVEAHGGRIWAESQVGDGATFYFTVPLAPASSIEDTTAAVTVGEDAPNPH